MDLGKGKWPTAGGGVQLYLLLTLWFFGIIVGASVSHLLLGEESYSTAYNIRISNSIGSIFLFLVPATIYTILFADIKGEFLIRKPIATKVILLAILTIFSIQPFVESVNYYNELITLPESMASLQEFFDQSKKSGEKTLRLIFADKTTSSLLVNFLVIAILPGIVEELFFRGCMQKSVLRLTNNIHVAIWVTAIIFSLLHFQLSGFFPRIILGALLGYLYAWTKNIWVPIIVHIINNASIVIIQQLLVNTDIYKNSNVSDYSISSAPIITIISIVTTTALLVVIYKLKSPEIEENQ